MSKEYNEEWRAKNKERIKAYRKEWREKNKERVNASYKKWRKKNPPKSKKGVRCKYKLNFYIVYSLMNGYVGKTNNPYQRMAHHKNKGRDVSDWFILEVCKTNAEALELERSYHNRGALGINPKHVPVLTDEQRIENRRLLMKRVNAEQYQKQKAEAMSKKNNRK